MADYIRVDNDENFIVIDDTYQNYQLVHKVSVAGRTFPRYSAGAGGPDEEDSHGFNLCYYTFNLTNIKTPVVAYRSNLESDTFVYSVNYTENSPNNWTLRVICQRRSDGNGADGILHLYVYGIPTDNYIPSTGAILHVLDEDGRMIFDSGKAPMRVVQYESFYAPWQVGDQSYQNELTPLKINIKNHKPNKVYAIVPCSLWFRHTNIQTVDNWLSYNKVNPTQPDVIICSPFMSGSVYAGAVSMSAPDWDLQTHSFLLLDVTGV